tara:strand:- start:4204 stop:4731 length:528 start_codon:yes stop_codon:yes gene_type:complete
MMFKYDTFKGSNGKTKSKSLFYELCYSETDDAVFTLKDRDLEAHGKLYLSLQKLYLSLAPNDPTEYEFAQTVFGSWEVWKIVSNSVGVKSHVAKWRREVEVKVKSEAIKAIAEEMKTNGRSSFSAAKLLLDKGWLDKDNASQAKQKLKAREEDDQNKQALSLLSEDAERLGIKVN